MSTEDNPPAGLTSPDQDPQEISTNGGTDNGGSARNNASSSETNAGFALAESTESQQETNTESQTSISDAVNAKDVSVVNADSFATEDEVVKIEQRPEASDSDTDDDQASETSGIFNTDYSVFRASKMNSKRLYDAYIKKLSTDSKDSDKQDTSGRASKLVRGFVDYLQTLDNRLDAMAEDFGQRFSALESAANIKRDSAADGKTGGENEETSSLAEGPAQLIDLKFYSASGHLDADGDWEDTEDQDAFNNPNGDKHIIRVLYNSVDPTRSKAEGESPPAADSIDVVYLGIQSQPILTFMRDRLDIDIGSSEVVRLSKPFRSLIRNIGSFRKQFEQLQEKYGVDKNDVHGGQKDAEQDVPADENTVLNDALPFQGLGTGNGEELAFETNEAFKHFQVFMGFIETYLSPQLRLFDRLKSGKETQVEFENLWMLFDAGVHIYCRSLESRDEGDPSDENVHIRKTRQLPQLFRVLGTRGGVPRKKTLAPPSADMRRPGPEQRLLSELLFFGSNQQNQSPALPDMASTRQNTDRYTPLSVVCFNVDFDGITYGTVREVFTFNPFNGPMDIQSLEAYPTQFLKPSSNNPLDGEAAKKEEFFLARGNKFLDATSKSYSYVSYEGWTLGNSREELISFGNGKINGAVVVDFKLSFQEYHNQFASSLGLIPKFSSVSSYWPVVPDDEVLDLWIASCGSPWCHTKGCIAEGYYSSQSAQVKKLEPNFRALFGQGENGQTGLALSFEALKSALEQNDLVKLLPGTVPGFVLRNRKWVQLEVERLQETEQRDDWDRLVLPKGHKNMVQAMVETHTSTAIQNSGEASMSAKVQMDVVQGKGRGCIILLHGVPGVGKTSTAECVASYAKKPLYPITCGDIGYSPEDVESNMEQHFKLADKWGCVLLLDEADVFLAKRTKSDVKRNGLVSVFLRILEYYPGILFLTTNRVGAIDDAFRSRLHLTLYYPPLEGKQALKIWKNHLLRIESINAEREKRKHAPIRIERNKIYEWAKRHESLLQWNGRQIRNAFQTAIALAEFRAKSQEISKGKSESTSTRGTSGKKVVAGPEVSVDDFRTIAKASLQFNEYLKETHGFDEETLAYRDQIRRKDRKTTPEAQNKFSDKKQAKKTTAKPPASDILSDTSSGFSSSESGSEDEDAADDDSDTDSMSEASSLEDAKTKKKRNTPEPSKKKHRPTETLSGGKEEEKGKRKKKKKVFDDDI